MKAVILAAGAATRLRPITDAIPKCLLNIGGSPLLQRAVDALLSHGIHEIAIVVGYRAEEVVSFCNKTYRSHGISCIENSSFGTTNNAYSLLLTEAEMQNHPMILLDGDILFDPRLIGHLLSSGHKDALLLRTSHFLDTEEIKAVTDAEGRVLRISKDVDPREAAGESIGIERFSESTARALFKILRRRISDERRTNEWYEASFQELIDNGTYIYGVDTAGLPCIEIDTPADIETAERDVLPLLGG